MKAPAIMQAMPSRCLLMLTVISFPPGLRLRQFCPSGSRLGFGAGDGTGGTLGGILVFSSGLTVLLHLRASIGGFRCALPDGVGSPERDCLRLNLLENPLRVDLRPFPQQGCPPCC